MYIDNIDKNNLFRCNHTVYSYLKTKLPLLSRDDEYYYFAKTELLEKTLKEAPFWVRVVIKCKV